MTAPATLKAQAVRVRNLKRSDIRLSLIASSSRTDSPDFVSCAKSRPSELARTAYRRLTRGALSVTAETLRLRRSPTHAFQ